GAWVRRLLGWGGAAAGAPTAAPVAGPNPAHALVVFGLAYVLLFFVFIPLQAWRLVPGLLISEWVGMLGLVVLYARATGQRVRDVLRVPRVPARALLGAAFVGASAWAVVSVLAEWILPPPPELTKNLQHLIGPEAGRGLSLTIALVALTPAICEEALFRGVI